MNTFIVDLPENSFVPRFEIANGHYITFEKYLEMDVEGARLEWVDGKVEAYFVNNLPHQEISSFIETLMRLFVETRNLGRVVRAGYAMKLDEQKRGREPDVLFVARENAQLLQFNFLDGAADIAVEVVSPESVESDYETKLREYEQAGVKEYWLIDPAEQRASFYLLNERNVYQLIDTTDGVFRSQILPRFFLRLEWLWNEQPPTIAALRELALI